MIDLSKKKQYAYSETITSGQTGEIIKLFPRYEKWTNVGITLIAGSSTGEIQITRSWDNETYDLPASPNWFPLEITKDKPDSITEPITALQAKSTSGEIKIEVVI